jgi:hypothetical protein
MFCLLQFHLASTKSKHHFHLHFIPSLSPHPYLHFTPGNYYRLLAMSPRTDSCFGGRTFIQPTTVPDSFKEGSAILNYEGIG